ncbi:DegT/DnrJ/EryC1/StrS family aminotransferase [Variovorax atrisoli]|uniref:DegT/DnrJ/EryC1/StrS family aminotransferase n=1 Tax=Variovorax atrisoli TaxID=3394203 RepID=UPI000F7EDE30|nr:DegT/DnrJ/EryC1/StrS family aminotransferase [Variovorax sp. 369]RTD95851.1 DegT/DnrJ/EryC1/StrS family aminotransferase [Variovorax sp. 369]
MIPFFDIHAGHSELADELNLAFQRVLKSGHLIMGPELSAFESEFADYCGVKHCIGVGNGLDALALTLRARGIKPGDEVIVPSQTFIATWLGVSMVGATPVPVEIDPLTYNLDPSRILSKVTSKTKAIVPVHLYGLPAAMSEIMEIAKSAELFVMEDAAQGHGATHHGKRTGALGHAATFSFYPTKNLGGMGDGGAIVTSDDDLADKLRMLRNYGSKKKYVHEVAGVNSRLDELQAAILRVKLSRLDEWNDRRRKIAQRYSAALDGVGDLRVPLIPPATTHVFHLYVVSTKNREELARYLDSVGISTLVHYPIPPHMQGAYSELAYAAESFPLGSAASNEALSLPIWPQMSFDQVDIVVEHVRKFFSKINFA